MEVLVLFSVRVFHNNRIDELCDYLSFEEANKLVSSLNLSLVHSLEFPCDDLLNLDPPFYFFIERLSGGTADDR